MKGLYRIAAAVPRLHLADPEANAEEILAAYEQAVQEGASIVVTPELSLTGSTCGDLFRQTALIQAGYKALARLCKATEGKLAALLVGLPIRTPGSKLYNCVAILQHGKISHIIGKKYLSNTREKLLFAPCNPTNSKDYLAPDAYFGEDFYQGDVYSIEQGNEFVVTRDFSIGIEIGSEADMPAPPSVPLALNSAQLIINPMAEMETGEVFRHRKTQVCAQSARLKAAYLSVGAGPGESTADGVFAGHAIAAINGLCVAESPRFSLQTHITYFDFIPRWLNAERAATAFDAESLYSESLWPLETADEPKYLHLPQNPFVPEDEQERHLHFDNLLAITATGLARRMEASRSKRLVIGLSGGLDSTLALVTCANACDRLGLPHDTILAITMPGMGTTGRTKNNAVGLAKALGAELREISIKPSIVQHFKDIDHPEDSLNVVYENAQARERTQILMDIANEVNGLVIGTGDLSEIAMGWCTYNGDQMAMYSVNATITKTTIRQLVEYIASTADPALAAHLRDVNATPISPELLPGEQHTESIIGNYDLHDFFLYHFVKHADTPEDICTLACHAFKGKYDEAKIRTLLKTFIRRFFTQQFKRNASPDGPSAGPLSLGARTTWQMPDDATFTPWTIE